MTYTHKSFNSTVFTKKGGLFAQLTGKNDLIFLRNRYQQELDNAWAAMINMQHHIEDSDDYNQTIIRTNAIAQSRGDVDDTKKDNANIYKDLYKCIMNDQAYEQRMWEIHQKMYNSDNKVNTNVTRSCYNENISVEAIRQYVTRYPTTQTTNSLQHIENMEQKLKEKRAEFRQNLALLRDYFAHFKLDLDKLKSKRKVYDDIKAEGEKQLNSCRYSNSVFYSACSEESKQSMRFDTIAHRIAQVDATIAIFDNTLKTTEAIIEVEPSKYQTVVAQEFIFDTEF